MFSVDQRQLDEAEGQYYKIGYDDENPKWKEEISDKRVLAKCLAVGKDDPQVGLSVLVIMLFFFTFLTACILKTKVDKEGELNKY
jgi:hypothetical protein